MCDAPESGDSRYLEESVTVAGAEPLGRQRSEGFMVIGSIGVSVRQDAVNRTRPNNGRIRMVFMGVLSG